MQKRTIYCCGCEMDVEARLTGGFEIYPYRKDLSQLPFWKCDTCGNYVGCHHKTNNPTRPLGNIPTPELRHIRKVIHGKLDRIWEQGFMSHKAVYAHLSKGLGRKYHTAQIRSQSEAEAVMALIEDLPLST